MPNKYVTPINKAPVTTEGDPLVTVVCHCYDCQKRAGSSHQVSAWFPDSRVNAVNGDSMEFTRVGNLGVETDFSFCPECGTTLYWRSSNTPDAHAIAVGCFAEPGFPAPAIEIFASRRHHWMPSFDDVTRFATIPGGLPGDHSADGTQS